MSRSLPLTYPVIVLALSVLPACLSLKDGADRGSSLDAEVDRPADGVGDLVPTAADASAPDADASAPDADAPPADADASAPGVDAPPVDADVSAPDADASLRDVLADLNPDDGPAPCPAGRSLCGATCVALATDTAHCGACGRACAAGQSCVAGLCGVVPPNDGRTAAVELTLTSPQATATADTTAASNDTAGPPGCACTSGRDVFFSFTLLQEEVVYADTLDGEAWNGSLFLQDAAGSNLAPAAGDVTCSDDACGTARSQLAARLAAGRYFLVASGCAQGRVTVRFQHLAVGSGGATRVATPSGTQTLTGTVTPGSGRINGGCHSEGGPENLYYFTTCPSFAAQLLHLSTCGGASWDTVLHQHSPSRSPLTVCNDDACRVQSSLDAALPAGTGLHGWYVDTYNGRPPGAFTLRYTLGACAAGFAVCGTPSACRHTDSDFNHCGGCDRPCASPRVCGSGVCCEGGMSGCDGACRNLQTDAAHCGACGATCTSGLCEAGQCVRAVDLAMGPTHTCAAMSDGSVRCWGNNARGQLGDGSVVARTTPVTLTGLSATQVAAAGEHTCARASDGTLRCWGANEAGQLGVGEVSTQSLTPRVVGGVTTAAEVTAGRIHTCARLADGSVSCWGHYLQVGTSSPAGCGAEACASPRPVGALSGVLGLSAGSAFTVARMMDGGTVQRWGIEPPMGMQVLSPRPIGGLSGVLEVSAGTSHACVILSDRTVRCWGSGAMGQLGSGATGDRGSGDPATVVGLSDVTQLAAGHSHTCARRADGTVWCWGDLLGAVLTAAPVSGLTNVVEVASGNRNACARLATGDVRCWGVNDNGQVGDGTNVTRATPVAVVWR